MKNALLKLSLLGSAAAILAGCNAGTAEAGATPEQTRSEIAKEDPMQQIRNLQFAPMNQQEKEKEISDIEKKYNVHREDAMKNLPPPKFDLSKAPPQLPTGK